jgi:hypothetical protein
MPEVSTGSTATVEYRTAELPTTNGAGGAAAAEPAPPAVTASITADEPRTEAERLDPQPQGPITLSTGTEVEIVPLRLRETMKLLRIITHGAGGYVGTLLDGLSLDDADAFAQSLATVLIMSLPDAENEAIDFLQSMCRPAHLDQVSDKKERAARLDTLKAELDNPELEDVVTVVETVVRRESEDIRALGKRLSQALNLAQRVGQAPSPEQTSPASPAGSAGP